MKLDYTKKELKKLGWATIGGRIEDYCLLFYLVNKRAAYKEIKKQYGKNTDAVYRGLLVCFEHGTEAYYNPKNLR